MCLYFVSVFVLLWDGLRLWCFPSHLHFAAWSLNICNGHVQNKPRHLQKQFVCSIRLKTRYSETIFCFFSSSIRRPKNNAVEKCLMCGIFFRSTITKPFEQWQSFSNFRYFSSFTFHFLGKTPFKIQLTRGWRRSVGQRAMSRSLGAMPCPFSALSCLFRARSQNKNHILCSRHAPLSNVVP